LKILEMTSTCTEAETGRSELIALLTPIWERVLQRAPIQEDENFFDLGGDYALVPPLFAQMSRALGRDLSLTLLYRAPTIGSLARELESGSTPATSALVLLSQGSVEPAVFFVPGLGGTLYEFSHLLSHIRCNHSIYGIQARGLESGEEPHGSIEEMAQYALEAIVAAQPHGPYLLLGNSFGGLVALELARQLSERGEKIALLALLDTYPYQRYWPLAAWLGVLKRRAWHHTAVVRELKVSELVPYLKLRWEGLRDHLRSRGDGHLPGWAANDEISSPALKLLRERGLAAAAGYRPRPYKGKITFFKPQVATRFPGNALTVWKHLAEEVEVHLLPGDHVGMSTTHAENLAAELSRCIEAAAS
jgi:thioesterase domain-containing protein